MRYACYLLMLSLIACSAPEEVTVDGFSSEARNSLMAFRQAEVLIEEGACDSDTARCATFRVDYPEFTAGDASAQNILNANIQVALVNLLAEFVPRRTLQHQSMQGLGKAFIDEFRRVSLGRQSGQMVWLFNTNVEVIYNTNEIVTIKLISETQTNATTFKKNIFYQSFDLTKGTQVIMEDLVIDEKKLTEIAEQQFRSMKSLSKGQDLRAAGFLFENNKFGLTRNFGVTEKGIIFYYNPKEISTTEQKGTLLLISFAELRDILRDKDEGGILQIE